MAELQYQLANEFQRLKAVTAQTRLRAILSQIAIGLTFCSIAESELENGHVFNAHGVVEKLRKLAGTMHRHLNEPNHVPSDQVERVRAELARLESRVDHLEAHSRRNFE